MAGYDYDVIAIGGGTGGLTVTRLVARRGKKAALIERFKPGGDCLFTGCVPTKSLIHAARVMHAARTGSRFGVNVGELTLDYSAVLRHVTEAQEETGKVESPEAIARNGVELVTGEARFVDPHTVEVDGRRLSAAWIVIATGGEPAVPPIPGLRESGFDTNVEAVAWESLPGSLVVIGGGPVGSEFGQLMHRLGAQVTILQSAGRILERDDPEASTLMQSVFAREGIAVHTGVEVTRVERAQGGRRVAFTANGVERTVECERLLVAVGRKPETASLNLAAAGVESNDRGIVVDDALRSSQEHIFAVGDVAGGYQFTHVAEAQGRLVANIITSSGFLSKRFQKWKNPIVPRVTYTDPEVASVGLTEEQAQAAKLRDIQVFRVPLAEVDRAVMMGETEGFFKIVTARGWNRWIPGFRRTAGDVIAGATLVAPHAGECLMPIVMAMRAGLPAGMVAWNMQAYPTLALGVRQVTGQQFDR